jgi:hypothetical protein
MELMKRLSWFERQSDNSEAMGQGEIKINIRRDEDIYNEQENDIRELTERIHEL